MALAKPEPLAPLTRQRGGENFFFRRGDCILFFESSARFLVGASGYFFGIETFIPLC